MFGARLLLYFLGSFVTLTVYAYYGGLSYDVWEAEFRRKWARLDPKSYIIDYQIFCFTKIVLCVIMWWAVWVWFGAIKYVKFITAQGKKRGAH